MPPGRDALQHLVVLMMENRSFDHMLGSLKAVDPRIDGLTGNEDNPDTTGQRVKVQAKAQYQSQLDPDPDHHFPAVNKQIFNGGAQPMMEGFIQSYFDQQRDVGQSRKIMYYFKQS
jgi:phospholipase C